VAKLIIAWHGKEAPAYAASRATEYQRNGDTDGSAVWRWILRSIEELRRDGEAMR
jgi:hypothetical protein